MTGSGTTVTLPSETQILITRQFAAAPALVYRAWTTPELVRRWWHAGRGSMTVCEIDLRVGGRWRYAMVAHSHGSEVAFHGEFRELVPDQRIVTTEVYEGMPDATAITTATFTNLDGVTTLTLLVEHTCREHRDGHVQSGMEQGLNDALSLLEALVVS